MRGERAQGDAMFLRIGEGDMQANMSSIGSANPRVSLLSLLLSIRTSGLGWHLLGAWDIEGCAGGCPGLEEAVRSYGQEELETRVGPG